MITVDVPILMSSMMVLWCVQHTCTIIYLHLLTVGSLSVKKSRAGPPHHRKIKWIIFKSHNYHVDIARIIPCLRIVRRLLSSEQNNLQASFRTPPEKKRHWLRITSSPSKFCLFGHPFSGPYLKKPLDTFHLTTQGVGSTTIRKELRHDF